MGSYNNIGCRLSILARSAPCVPCERNVGIKFFVRKTVTFTNVSTTRDVHSSVSIDFFANEMVTSINLDLRTQESAYLYIFRELEYFIPSQIVQGLSWEIARHARVEAISCHEPNMKVQLRFFIDIKYEREIVEGEHPEPETETEALQHEDEIIVAAILENEIEETATEFEFRQLIELSSQEGYIFEGEYQPMEIENLQLLRAIEASSQIDFPLRPAARSAVKSLARPDIEAQEEVVCTVCMCNISTGDGRVLPCSHIYHADCIFRWLELRNSCPICRFQLPVQE
ncbi:hypothetical protein AMTR_s00009p00260680 [Amborella trichopoda]|uniref:RING-type domain-containing protein n=1 Tax=Amborella trichopoda TaxID=13333 RepID=W1NH68_AMBTC|nr:hypothetical protein AMTR_s00009p00260680 [Amborella trichopoda]